MKTLIAKSNWMKIGDFRLDSSFHLNDGRISKLKIEKSPYERLPLKSLAVDIYNGARFKRYYVRDPKLGLPFMGSSDMLKSNLNDLKYISKKLSKNTDSLIIKKNWVLVSCSGTIGNTVFTTDDFHNKTASQHVMRIVPNGCVHPGYLYAFLSSKFGYSLLTQGTYGAVIQHIEPHHIENLYVPILPISKQLKIHNLIDEASSLRVLANKLLKEATQCFEKIIGTSNVHVGFQTGSVSSNSLKVFHKRLDSQYHLLWKALKKEEKTELKYKKLHCFASSIFVGGRGKRIYVENGVPFLSSSDMMLFNPRRNCKNISKYTKGIDAMIVSKQDILISRSGTVGNTVLVGDDLAGTAISEHALRIVIDSEKISPNYVFCFLKTKYGMKSMEASSFGSVIITLNEDLVGNINLPILDKESQDKINALIETYITKLDEATKKENEAIDLVENEIESWQK